MRRREAIKFVGLAGLLVLAAWLAAAPAALSQDCIESVDLAAAFAADPAGVEAKYSGRRLCVRGVVTGLAGDDVFWAGPVLRTETGPEVVCEIAESEVQRFVEIMSDAESVELSCLWGGFRLFSQDDPAKSLTFHDCVPR